MNNGEMLHSVNLKIDSGETLKDAKETRLKMRNKMVQINYEKLNALYETFVPQQESSIEQTYFLIPSTSNNGFESKEVASDLPIPKIPKESKLLKMFDKMGLVINDLRKRINVTLLEDRKRRWMSDCQNSLRKFYKTDVIPMSNSLSKNLKELQQELIEEVQEMLNIFESMEQKVKEKSPKEQILQNEIDRLLEVSLTSEIRDYVFLLSHENCVARYSLSRNSKVKRALFTTPVAAKSKNLGATFVVAKSRLSIATTPTTTNKVSSVLPLSPDSSQSIVHNTSITRTPQQNGVVEHRNHILVEAARIMLIFSKSLEFLWAEDIANVCFTQNRSIVHTRYNKTPYELIRGRKPNVQYFYMFGSLCYPKNDRDDLGKIKPKADIGIFIGYSKSLREPEFNCINFQDSSEDSQSVPSKTDLDNLFGPLYEEYFAMSSPEVLDNSAAHTLDNNHTSSSSSIVVEENEAPQIISSSTEQVTSESNTPVLNDITDEFQKTLQNLTKMFSTFHLKLLCLKKPSHLQHIRIHQICMSFTKNIAILISGLRIIQLNK
ncbi:retrovirus-related pol polyprotein from transposon TNT 1-94 [Tanacetum coccineum]